MISWTSDLNAVSSVWFESLARAAWQGAIALALIWVLSRYLEAIPSASKVWLWRLAFLKLLVAFVWITPVALPVLPSATELPTALPAELESMQSSVPPSDAAQPLPGITAPREVFSWASWLLIAWIIGVLCGATRILLQWFGARAIVRNCRRTSDPVLVEMLRRIGRASRLGRLPLLCQCPSVCSPMIIGVFRTRIILPSSPLAGFTAPQVEMMLAHELAHVRRRDICWLWLFTLCETIFFFHPLVWFARSEWTLAMESACDEFTLRATRHAAHDYGSMLIEVVAQISGRDGMCARKDPAMPVIAVGMFETANALKRRLKLMATDRTAMSTAIGIALIAFASLSIVPCRLVAQAPDPATLARLKEENAKLKRQLDSTRQEMEALRKEAMAAKQHDKVLEKRKLDLEQFQKKIVRRERVREEQEKLEQAKRELQLMSHEYTPQHPAVRQKISEVNQMQLIVDAMQMESSPQLNLPGLRNRWGRAEAPSAPGQHVRFQNRELLLEEIMLAEQQAEFVRENLKAGTAPYSDLLTVHRELLDLKLELAQLDGSKTDQRAVLQEQFRIGEQQLQEVKARIEAGTLPKGAAIPFERELLRLKRSLNALE